MFCIVVESDGCREEEGGKEGQSPTGRRICRSQTNKDKLAPKEDDESQLMRQKKIATVQTTNLPQSREEPMEVGRKTPTAFGGRQPPAYRNCEGTHPAFLRKCAAYQGFGKPKTKEYCCFSAEDPTPATPERFFENRQIERSSDP